MVSESHHPLIPVTLLTGFLGSGKTTLLNQLVSQPAFADTLIIINEFGEMALDHLLVTRSTENIVMEMSSGCVCCSIRGDLVQTLRDITWRFAREGRRQFDRVLIETTGLADPTPIIHTLMTHPQIAPKYRLDGVITTIDLATAMATLDRHPEAVKQAAVADVLLLTKGDLANGAQRTELLKRLDSINPASPRWEVTGGNIEAEKLLGLGLFPHQGQAPDIERWLKEDTYKVAPTPRFTPVTRLSASPTHGVLSVQPAVATSDLNRHDDHIRAFCFSVDAPITEESLAVWLEILMALVGNNILRIKGILNVKGQAGPVALHGVQHIFHPPVQLPTWPTEDRQSRIVFITYDVGLDIIEATFKAFHSQVSHFQGSNA